MQVPLRTPLHRRLRAKSVVRAGAATGACCTIGDLAHGGEPPYHWATRRSSSVVEQFTRNE